MNKLEKTIPIKAPAHIIFEYILETPNLTNLCSRLVDIEDTQRLPNGGRSFKWEYKMVNVHFFGTSTCTKCVVNHHLVNSIRGGITGSITWLLRAEGDQTHTTLIVEYALPTPFIQKHGNNAIEQENEYVVIALLDSLKTTVEKAVNHIV